MVSHKEGSISCSTRELTWIVGKRKQVSPGAWGFSAGAAGCRQIFLGWSSVGGFRAVQSTTLCSLPQHVNVNGIVC